MKKSTIAAAGIVLVASSMVMVAYASADPNLNAATNTMVATGVSDFVGAEQAAQEAAAKAAAEAEAAAAAEEAARAEQAKENNNTSGVGPSAYTGEYYDPAAEATRQCIVMKESGGNYGVVSSNGMYHGAYQFMQATADSAAMKMGRPDLVGVPPEQWTRAEQDEAFWVTWNHGAGSGNWPTANGC